MAPPAKVALPVVLTVQGVWLGAMGQQCKLFLVRLQPRFSLGFATSQLQQRLASSFF